MICVLAGGTGGAKLARGLLEAVGPNQLTVVANTGDDITVHGLHVSPDPDLVTYWLADLIDAERGWGIAGESFEVQAQLERLGAPDAWIRLGDQDLATCALRSGLLRQGARLTEAAAVAAVALGVEARVLPMSDESVRTHVRTEGEWRHFQDYLIRQRCKPALEGVEFRGAEAARPSPEVLAALAGAEAIVIGPSNPIASIGPILALPGLREALETVRAPVVAVSPLVGGRSLKGPTEAFLRQAGLPVDPDGIVAAYGGLLDGLVTDEAPAGPAPELCLCETLMPDGPARVALAERTLHFARGLAGALRGPT